MFDYISETIRAMPIKFAVQVVQLKVYNNYYILCQSDDLDLYSSSQLRLKVIYWHIIMPMLIYMTLTLTLMQGHSGFAEE